MENLIDQFAKVGLSLKKWDRRDGIFAMDIRGDDFVLQVGEGNDVIVQSADQDMGQLVLFVREEGREFEAEIDRQFLQRTDRIVRSINPRRVVVRRRTEDGKRHLLIGRDEMGHPFATTLPGSAVTVRDAHELLKPGAVEGKAIKGKGKNYKTRGKRRKATEDAVRQGEWFFVEVTSDEEAAIEKNAVFVERNRSIGAAFAGRRGAAGNPHVAEESVAIRHPEEGLKVFVRGKIRHDEHKTLKFNRWMRAFRNTEPVNERVAGMTWVD